MFRLMPGFLRGIPATLCHSAAMILTPAELDSLVNAQHPSPHQLLGMHPLGDGSGLVVRALLQNAASVEVAPVHELEKPRFALQMLDARGVLEQRAHHEARAIAQRVHPEQLVGRGMQGVDEAVQFRRRQNHGGSVAEGRTDATLNASTRGYVQ